MTYSLLSDPYSSANRPAIRGLRGAISSAHPLATAAGQEIFMRGGNAADAVIAAQAALAVLCPDACGLGGDMLALVDDGASVAAVSGTGRAPLAMREATTDGANSITVPGIVDAWARLAARWGRLGLGASFAPAIRLAEEGFLMGPGLHRPVVAQAKRLYAGGAGEWSVLRAALGSPIRQPELATLLRAIATEGTSAFYAGEAAHAIERAVQRKGGALACQDLAAHDTEIVEPIALDWRGWSVSVQPPPTQGVLLAMALGEHERLGDISADLQDHVCVELTEAAFAYRTRAAEGAALLDIRLEVDRARASRRGGPRAYLHTAGVAASDAAGLTISSLVSVFDDFGSCLFVPELGITLNNRAGGFTDGPNSPAPGKRPVHTLAPALVRTPAGSFAIATPGADGQVQTLLQIFAHIRMGSLSLDAATAAPRWRSEGGKLLIEAGHPAIATLDRLGHELVTLAPGDTRFGAVTAAGRTPEGCFAVADWRRECWSGAA